LEASNKRGLPSYVKSTTSSKKDKRKEEKREKHQSWHLFFFEKEQLPCSNIKIRIRNHCISQTNKKKSPSSTRTEVQEKPRDLQSCM
jgi:hypothetical protein